MRAVERSTDSRYQLAHDPEIADVILFVEPQFAYQSDIIMAPLYGAFAEKSVVLDFLDNPKPVVPGLYVGLRKDQCVDGVFEGSAYIRVADNERLERARLAEQNADLLFSFIGKSQNATYLRSAVLKLSHPRGLVVDRTSNQSESDDDYVQTLARSKFVLCPRGIGPSSWRLFEAMRIGRVPVVIADDWVPPMGIDWDSFVVRVAEKNVQEIPAILYSLEAEASLRGRRAREEWERNLSYDRMFGWIGDRCVAILENGRQSNYAASFSRQLARVDSVRSAARLLRERSNALGKH